MSIRVQLVVAIMASLATAASAQSRSEIAAVLNRDFKGKIIMQKQFAGGAKLVYAADGTAPGAKICAWTACGQIRVRAVKLPNEGTIRIEGERLLLTYNGKTEQFEELRQKKNQNKVVVEIRIGARDEAAARNAIAKVFLGSEDHLSDYTPAFWRNFLVAREVKAGERPKSDLASSPPADVVKVGSNKGSATVTAPRAISSPDPEYSEFARKIKYQSSTKLWVVVGKDGGVRDIQVADPAGVGFEEQAVEAVSKWRFEPALRGDEPVAVQVQVYVNFRLY